MKNSKFIVHGSQFTVFKIVLFIFFLYSIFFLLYSSPTAAQQVAPCGVGTLPRADSLVSAGSFSLTSKFLVSGGACIADTKTAFATFKVPTYEDLLNTYYSKAVNGTGGILKSENTTVGTIDFTNAYVDSTNGSFFLYNFSNPNSVVTTSSLAGTPTINSPKTTLVFVNGSLNITNNIAYTGNDAGGTGGNNVGLVFVVKGDVFIQNQAALTQINAIIISYGQICTAASGTTCPAINTTQLPQLNIYGSLVSMNKEKPILFKRVSTNPSTTPGEFITAQPKYFYILKNIFAENLIITTQENTFPAVP